MTNTLDSATTNTMINGTNATQTGYAPASGPNAPGPFVEADITPVVETHSGKVRGCTIGGINSFKGIPYAAPPFGANRYRAPQRVEPWAGVRDALSYGPKAPQLPYPPPWDMLLPELVEGGEDCLSLNIWSPELRPTGLPVMVWIPGGVFEHGTAAMAGYDGSRFARDGIVCVSINYRVGADGFLYLGDGKSKSKSKSKGDADANFGLLDQLAALEWVQENIAAFGGDPANVTVFGESAGAMSIAMLLAMPRAEGLFRRAIVQSGGAHPVMSAASAQLVRQRLAEKLGVKATREGIDSVFVDRMLQAQAELKADIMARPDPEHWGVEVAVSFMPWQPVIDGEILPEHPLDRIAGGASSSIDLIVGSNLEEWRFFTVPDGSIDRITPEILGMLATGYGLPLEGALATYRAANPGANPGDLLAAIQGDWYVRIPALRLADAHAMSTTRTTRTTSNASTYMYEFAWRSPQFDGRLGACHGLEVPFVFDVFSPGSENNPLAGANPPQQLADTMHAAWVGFATSGEALCDQRPWPKYDLSRRATMRFDTTPEVVEDPRYAVRTLWEGVH